MILLLIFAGMTSGYLLEKAIGRNDYLLGIVAFQLYYFVGIVGMFYYFI